MRIAVLAGLAGLVLLGCGRGPGDDAVVISVGPAEIRAAEFRHLFREAAARDSALAGDVAGRMRFAETLAEELLFEQLFFEREKNYEGARADRIEDFRERRMVEYLREVEYGDLTTVTDAELSAAYEKLGTRRHVRRMLLETEQKATEVRRAVMEGALFDRVAMQVSLEERTRDLGGDLGWLAFTDLPGMERDDVWSTKVGEISPPIAAGALWVIYQVIEEDVNHSRGTLEEERAALEAGIRQRRQARAVARYRGDLFARGQFRIDPAELAWLTVHMREQTRGTTRGTAILDAPETEEREGYVVTHGSIPWTGSPVAPADTGRVVATYGPDGKVDPLLVYDQLMTKPTPSWPTFETSRDVENLIRELVLERLEQAEAYARGYDQAPVVLYDLRQREREVRGRQVIRNQLRNPSIPTEAEIRAEYERRIAEFTTPETRRFLAVNCANREAAGRAAEMLRAGRAIEEVVAAFAPADSVRTTGRAGTPPMKKGESPALDDVLFALGPGEVSDPIPVGTSFTVAQVIEIVPEQVKPFEDVRVDVQVEMVDRRIEPLQAKLLEEARVTYPVHIDVAVLRELDLDGSPRS